MIGVAALLGLSLSLQAPDQIPVRADARQSKPPVSSRIGAPTDSGTTGITTAPEQTTAVGGSNGS